MIPQQCLRWNRSVSKQDVTLSVAPGKPWFARRVGLPGRRPWLVLAGCPLDDGRPRESGRLTRPHADAHQELHQTNHCERGQATPFAVLACLWLLATGRRNILGVWVSQRGSMVVKPVLATIAFLLGFGSNLIAAEPAGQVANPPAPPMGAYAPTVAPGYGTRRPSAY